ncbi:MAG: AAA family ATPase [Anaerolineae bacterium]|nr:AAA family ATPase [Anaerolineae bacterium]
MPNDKIRIVVGYGAYAELTALSRILEGSQAEIVEAAQTAQKLFDACAPEALGGQEPDIALVNPAMQGYAHALITDLLMRDDGPVPVFGYVAVEDVQSFGPGMLDAGARFFFALAKPPAATDLIRKMQAEIAALRQEWEEGRLRPKLTEVIPRAGAVHQQVITAWVPKGGGSTRTTICVNLAAALASAGNPVALVDFDQTKGDAHIMLGFTPDDSIPVTRGMTLVERGLYDLMVNVFAGWEKSEKAAVTAHLLNQYMVKWSSGSNSYGAGDRLHILPGLTAAHQAGTKAFGDAKFVHEAGLAIIDTLKSMYTFVIVDIGQDYNMPLHAAALQAATEVLVPIPPVNTAVVDAARGLPALRGYFGNLEKFRWLPTAWRDGPDSPSLKRVTDTVSLPRLDVIIPHDLAAADQAVNGGIPFALSDAGPLGEAIRDLARNYDASVPRHKGKKSGGLRSLFAFLIREA